jgi:hypothetical protein
MAVARGRALRRPFYHGGKLENISPGADQLIGAGPRCANWLETGGARVQNIVASATRDGKRAR